jgi:hypothetical protein
MPLQYDDVPGSWGTGSREWPALVFPTSDLARRAYIACTKANVVPYGSYVLMDDTNYPRQWKNGKATTELRIETIPLRDKLEEYLYASPYKTYEDLRDHYIKEGLWK